MCEVSSRTPLGMVAFALCSQLLMGSGTLYTSPSLHPQSPCSSCPLILSYGYLASVHLNLTQALTSSEVSELPVLIICTCVIPASLSFQDLCLIWFFTGSFVLLLLNNLCCFFFLKSFLSSIVMSFWDKRLERVIDGQVGPLNVGGEARVAEALTVRPFTILLNVRKKPLNVFVQNVILWLDNRANKIDAKKYLSLFPICKPSVGKLQ